MAPVKRGRTSAKTTTLGWLRVSCGLCDPSKWLNLFEIIPAGKTIVGRELGQGRMLAELARANAKTSLPAGSEGGFRH